MNDGTQTETDTADLRAARAENGTAGTGAAAPTESGTPGLGAAVPTDMAGLSEAVRTVLAALRERGVAPEVRTFAGAVPTAAAAAERLGCEVGAIANSLVFAAPGAGPDGEPEPVLVLTSGAHRVDTKRVAALLGVPKLKRATPEQVYAATGQRVGGCAPVGHPRPLRTVVDIRLGDYDVVWAGAGDEHTMHATTLHDQTRHTTGTIAEVGD